MDTCGSFVRYGTAHLVLSRLASLRHTIEPGKILVNAWQSMIISYCLSMLGHSDMRVPLFHAAAMNSSLT